MLCPARRKHIIQFMHLRGQMPAGGQRYHVSNRGAHRQAIWKCVADYERFLLLLYLNNTRYHVVMRDVLSKYSAMRFKGQCFEQIFRHEYCDKSLVDILGYCLMPDSFDLILRPKTGTSIQTFMQKVCGAYSMYFNRKYQHTGTLFEGRYAAKHIESDERFQEVLASIHLSPIELLQPDWKEVGIRNKRKARAHIKEYRYSSLLDSSMERPQREILAEDVTAHLSQADAIDELMRWEIDLPNTKVRAL